MNECRYSSGHWGTLHNNSFYSLLFFDSLFFYSSTLLFFSSSFLFISPLLTQLERRHNRPSAFVIAFSSSERLFNFFFSLSPFFLSLSLSLSQSSSSPFFHPFYLFCIRGFTPHHPLQQTTSLIPVCHPPWVLFASFLASLSLSLSLSSFSSLSPPKAAGRRRKKKYIYSTLVVSPALLFCLLIPG